MPKASRQYHRWSEAELVKLRLLHPTMSNVDLAKAMGRPVANCVVKATQLGLRKSPEYLATIRRDPRPNRKSPEAKCREGIHRILKPRKPKPVTQTEAERLADAEAKRAARDAARAETRRQMALSREQLRLERQEAMEAARHRVAMQREQRRLEREALKESRRNELKKHLTEESTDVDFLAYKQALREVRATANRTHICAVCAEPDVSLTVCRVW